MRVPPMAPKGDRKGRPYRRGCNCHVANTPVARRQALLSWFDQKEPVCHSMGG